MIRTAAYNMNRIDENIACFMTRSYEKSIDYYMLSDKNYVVPKQRVKDYIDKLLAIPYYEFIKYVRDHIGTVKDDQLTQSSNFAACSSDMCRAIERLGNPGMRFVDIGQQFPQYVKVKNEAAFRKYGENQIKTSAQLGLTFDYYGYWYLTCIGYIYNDLEEQRQKSLLARTILRIPLYQKILIELLENDVDLTNYMQSLSDSTKGRRSGSIVRMINLCLDECKKEGINYHNLFYPNYNAREKKLIMAIQEGYEKKENTIEINLPLEESPHHHTDVLLFQPKGSMLYDVADDEEVCAFIHNMMTLYEGTTIMRIVIECQKVFQLKYFSMKNNDWRHILTDYIRKKTKRNDLQEDEVFRHKTV